MKKSNKSLTVLLFATFVDFCIAAVIFIVLLLFYKVSLTLNMFYVIPILLIQILFTLAVSLFASAMNVYYRDVKHALPFFIQFWMYLSPVIYPVSSVPERFKQLYMFNPMASIINSYRDVLLMGIHPDFYYLSISAIVTMILLFLSYRYFKMVEMSFADRI